MKMKNVAIDLTLLSFTTTQKWNKRECALQVQKPFPLKIWEYRVILVSKCTLLLNCGKDDVNYTFTLHGGLFKSISFSSEGILTNLYKLRWEVMKAYGFIDFVNLDRWVNDLTLCAKKYFCNRYIVDESISERFKTCIKTGLQVYFSIVNARSHGEVLFRTRFNENGPFKLKTINNILQYYCF